MKFTFVLNSGTGQVFCHVCDSAKLILPSEPTKEGYSFVSWCVDSAFSATFNPYYRIDRYTDDTLKLTKDTTLYALWINGEKIQRADCQCFYWCAYEDEPGLYTNQTKGTSEYDGRNNTGGDAIAACQNRGRGWFLPATYENYNADYMGNYWSSTSSNSDKATYSTVLDGYKVLAAGTALKTQQMRVRCVWRPPYEQ